MAPSPAGVMTPTVRPRRQRASSFPSTPERTTTAESGSTAPPPAGASMKMAATHRPVCTVMSAPYEALEWRARSKLHECWLPNSDKKAGRFIPSGKVPR